MIDTMACIWCDIGNILTAIVFAIPVLLIFLANKIRNLFKNKPKETPESKFIRCAQEWYVHNTGLDKYYTVQEMIDKGYLSLPEYEKNTKRAIKYNKYNKEEQ